MLTYPRSFPNNQLPLSGNAHLVDSELWDLRAGIISTRSIECKEENTMHPEEEVDQSLVGDYVGIKRDLNRFCMPGVPSTNLAVGRVGSLATGVSDDDFV